MNIPSDKQGHIIGGAIIATAYAVIYGIPAAWFIGRAGILVAFAAAQAVVMGVGAIKEYLDSLDREHHSVEFLDFLATCVGGLFVLVPLSLMVWLAPLKMLHPFSS